MTRQQIIRDYNLTAVNTDLLTSMTQTLKHSLKADIATFSLYSEDTVHVLTLETNESLEGFKIPSFDIKDSVGISAIEIKRPLFVVDAEQDQRTNHSRHVIDSFKIKSIAVYPIIHRASGEMVATLSCFYTSKTELTNDEKIIFQAFGKTMSKAFNDIASTTERKPAGSVDIDKVQQYNQDLIDSQQYGFDETVYRRSINYMTNLTGAATGVLASYDTDNKTFTVNGFIMNNALCSFDNDAVTVTQSSRFLNAIHHRNIVLLNDLDESYKEEIAATFPFIDTDIENCLGIPLLVRNNLVGFIALFNADNGFYQESLVAFKGLVGSISSLVVNDQMKIMNEHYQQQIEIALKQDELTSIPNMTGGVEYLEKLVADKTAFTLCLIDLDKFAHLNTIYNRSEGDIALVTIANRINNVIRKKDFFSRVGGDMLMLAFNDHQSEEKIQEILDVISRPIEIQEDAVSIYASAAYLHGPVADISGERHLSLLFNPLYKAKQYERIEFADTEADLLRTKEVQFLQDFNYAVKENQILLYGMPAYHVESNEVMCVEVLSRWNHPVRGVLSPYHFLPALGKDNASLALFDYAVVMKSVHFLLTLQKQRQPFPMLCINVSPALIASKEADDLLHYFSHDLDAAITQNLCFELIEWDEHGNDLALIKKLRDFKETGVKIALDDFGTGYSNIDRLMSFPVDIVKVDQAFTRELEDNTTNQIAIQSMIDIAHRLEKTIIVEGVETASQLELLKKMGCKQVQGFYFTEPMPLEKLI